MGISIVPGGGTSPAAGPADALQARGDLPPAPPDPLSWPAAPGESGTRGQKRYDSFLPPVLRDPSLVFGPRGGWAEFAPSLLGSGPGNSATAPDHTRPAAFAPPPPAEVHLPQIDLYLYDETLGLDVLVGHIPAGPAPVHHMEDGQPLPYLLPDHIRHQAPAQAFMAPAAAATAAGAGARTVMARGVATAATDATVETGAAVGLVESGAPALVPAIEGLGAAAAGGLAAGVLLGGPWSPAPGTSWPTPSCPPTASP